MLGKSKDQSQGNLFTPNLTDFINLQHPLVQLADRIDWKRLEESFAQYYSHTGQPSKPVRLMAGLLLLKQMYNLGDETQMSEWVRDPYFQYFCGEARFQHRPPSDLVHFRKRIGPSGVERILELSISLHSAQVNRSRTMLVDTTVQEKNITYPTDAKLYKKILDQCNAIAANEGVPLRQSYVRVSEDLVRAQHNGHHPKRRRAARKARRKLTTLAGRQVRDLRRKLSAASLEHHRERLELFERVLRQERTTRNKVYSLHEPDVACIAKGKTHKKYAFGSKISVAGLPGSNIIVGVESFTGNPHDGKTLEPALKQVERLTGRSFQSAVVDRGCRGQKQIGDTEVILPTARTKLDSNKQRRYRKKCRSRAALEALISHLKFDYRMFRCYLKGVNGDKINAMMAAAAFNMCKWMRLQAEKGLLVSRLRNLHSLYTGFVRLMYQTKLTTASS